MNASKTISSQAASVVADWNRAYPVGTAVICALEPEQVRRTRSEALTLFGTRPAVYLQGLDGYFDLRELRRAPQGSTATPSPEPRSGIAVMFPGQGAQFRGMGRGLFEAYPDLADQASDILGYSIERLCLEDPDDLLSQTQYTQPALYVVGALGWRALCDEGAPASQAELLMGHSLGEFNALLAARAFDFETGLRLVQKRGELMAASRNGGLAAVLGVSIEQVRQFLTEHGFDGIDLSSQNSPTQIVLAGPVDELARTVAALSQNAIRAIPLKVSAAFHSRYMIDAQEEFSRFLAGFDFATPCRTVVSNATAKPYASDDIRTLLAAQIASPVRWMDSIQFAIDKGLTQFIEVGSSILGPMVSEIRGGAA
jgi:trans-AT polyketide synthase/acyltransferase/oxidoreductase domain-containing protein